LRIGRTGTASSLDCACEHFAVGDRYQQEMPNHDRFSEKARAV
jgi:hypothetical protein